jgi:PhnB protein
MKTINPWINFNGNAEEAFNFYQSILGGEIKNIVRFKDIATEASPVAPEDAEKIMRINLLISDGQMLIGNDVPTFMGKTNERENRSKICVVTGKKEGQDIFAGLSAGGEVEVPFDGTADTSFAMFRDKYGIEWIIESVD